MVEPIQHPSDDLFIDLSGSGGVAQWYTATRGLLYFKPRFCSPLMHALHGCNNIGGDYKFYQVTKHERLRIILKYYGVNNYLHPHRKNGK